MSKSIFESLYFGKVTPHVRRVTHSSKRNEIERKIKSEKEYFNGKMSFDDCQRFQELENQYSKASIDEEAGIFSHGFTLGALIMLEIMLGKEGVVNE